ncbi:hypothetical protein CBL_04318 [Carabus blaptoides fortunei]
MNHVIDLKLIPKQRNELQSGRPTHFVIVGLQVVIMMEGVTEEWGSERVALSACHVKADSSPTWQAMPIVYFDHLSTYSRQMVLKPPPLSVLLVLATSGVDRLHFWQASSTRYGLSWSEQTSWVAEEEFVNKYGDLWGGRLF